MKDVVSIFKALSDPTRLRIVLLLTKRDLCVCELTFILGMEQSRVSHHMRVLREADIAEDVRDGRWIIYRLQGDARPLLAGLFEGALRERIWLSREVETDLGKLEDCLRQNIRSCVCESRPRAGGQ